MKIASHVLLFNQQKWILKNIENSAPYVDKIYVSYSKHPWNYNKKDRDKFINTADLSILKESKYFDKIEIIEGKWDLDEDQRNACLDKAKADGFDYLITHDADEFYTDSDFSKMIQTVKENPDHDYYVCDWITFWKDINHVICNQNMDIKIGEPEIVVNLNRNNRFTRCRIPSGKDRFKIKDILCYHTSYVLTDGECWSKINTWGHAHQFDTKKWYDTKWLNWNENIENLHPISPKAWKKAIKFNGDLPKELK